MSEISNWIMENGSGSLRRAKEEEMAFFEFYLHERIAFELATAAELLPSSRVLQGKAMAEPDERATTESCWYARVLRYRLKRVNLNVSVKVRYLNVTYSDESVKEGIGLVFENIEDNEIFNWIPKNRTCFCFVSIWDGKNWDVENPC